MKRTILIMALLVLGTGMAMAQKVETFKSHKEYVEVMLIRNMSGFQVVKEKKKSYILHNEALDSDIKVAKNHVNSALDSIAVVGDLLFFDQKKEVYRKVGSEKELSDLISEAEEQVRKKH